MSGDENLFLQADKEYDIFFMPKHCNDVFKSYNTKYPSHTSLKTSQKGINFFSVNFSGSKGDKATVSMDNSQIINLFLNTTSLSQKTDQKQHFIIGFLILLVAVFVGIYRRY